MCHAKPRQLVLAQVAALPWGQGRTTGGEILQWSGCMPTHTFANSWPQNTSPFWLWILAHPHVRRSQVACLFCPWLHRALEFLAGPRAEEACGACSSSSPGARLAQAAGWAPVFVLTKPGDKKHTGSVACWRSSIGCSSVLKRQVFGGFPVCLLCSFVAL